MEEKWTKISFWAYSPPQTVMKPYPVLVLNHFTCPIRFSALRTPFDDVSTTDSLILNYIYDNDELNDEDLTKSLAETAQ
jgi:hypothetical protein